MRIQSWGLFFTVALWGTMGATAAPAAENFPISLNTMAMTEVPPLGHADRYLPQEDVVHVVLRLGERRVYVYRGDQVQASYPVAIGKAETPTPTGTFEVFQMIENPVWQTLGRAR